MTEAGSGDDSGGDVEEARRELTSPRRRRRLLNWRSTTRLFSGRRRVSNMARCAISDQTVALGEGALVGKVGSVFTARARAAEMSRLL